MNFNKNEFFIGKSTLRSHTSFLPIYYLLSNPTDNLPLMNIRLESPMRLSNIPPVVHLINDGPHLPLTEMRQDPLSKEIAHAGLVLGIARPQRRRQHPDALVQQSAQVELRDLAPAQRGDEHDARVHRRARRVAHPVVPPNQVDDQVDAAAVRGAVHDVREVLGAVVHGDVGPQGPAQLALFVAARCRDDRRGAPELGDLDGGLSDAGGARVDEHGLARLDVADEVDGLDGGEECLDHQLVVRLDWTYVMMYSPPASQQPLQTTDSAGEKAASSPRRRSSPHTSLVSPLPQNCTYTDSW